MNVYLSLRAQDDFRDIVTYISERFTQQAAQIVAGKLEHGLRYLAANPDAGSAYEFRTNSVRLLVVGKYLLIYRREANRIVVARIAHTSRNWQLLIQDDAPEQP